MVTPLYLIIVPGMLAFGVVGEDSDLRIRRSPSEEAQKTEHQGTPKRVEPG
jgi:hypothetical protein